MQHVTEIRRGDIELAGPPLPREAETDAVPERDDRERPEAPLLLLCAHRKRLRHEQRLVVEHDPCAPLRPEQLLEVELFVAEDRRPDEPCSICGHEPLAADGDGKHLVLGDMRAIEQAL